MDTMGLQARTMQDGTFIEADPDRHINLEAKMPRLVEVEMKLGPRKELRFISGIS